jgi:hypothetical protein
MERARVRSERRVPGLLQDPIQVCERGFKSKEVPCRKEEVVFLPLATIGPAPLSTSPSSFSFLPQKGVSFPRFASHLENIGILKTCRLVITVILFDCCLPKEGNRQLWLLEKAEALRPPSNS